MLTGLLAVGIVGDFSHPLSDGTDTDQFEYVGYVFASNLTLWPWPMLHLLNNQTFYPYGINQIFLDWGFERDYWYAICYRLFGPAGPYLQYYYVYTLVLTAVGSCALLRPWYGFAKSALFGLAVSVFNVYAVWKFPVHMNVCIDHWTVLCMVATYRLLRDVLDRRPLTLSFVLVWVWLHVQVLGQELAYVAGYALTFTTLTLPVLGWALWRWYQQTGWAGIIAGFKPGASGWLMIGLILLSLWLYLPLTIQIAFGAWGFDFAEVPLAPLWSSPVRLLIPYLPGLHTFDHDYSRWIHDIYESFGQGSPGLGLVVLAGLGWWQIRRRVALWLPIGSMLVLCLLYHPVLLPTLKLFPWFTYNRHGGRASLVYPVLFGLLALSVRWPRHRVGAVIGIAVLGLLGAEWYTAYRLREFVPTPVVSADVLRYCAVIRQQPGVAVLDFPFCTVGADGVGKKEGLCPYYVRQNAVFTFRRFYDKKGVGQYFGRLHPDQIQPFLRDNWPRLLAPGHVFTDTDWQFLDSFLRENHFAGINLYPDLLTPEQLAGFYRRYGNPIAQTRFPEAGRLVFVPLR
ncbi:hypothetical protein HH216_15725 [Spirosoma rhododendri]|uniref:Glycosyltransferase RgtA/B/C/D-like domain-containing protein n=1 Tax=Spirosoma rhododendri TaxID=2728024 RepID=A0A7L5DTB6_9BACT|nr:hypothetical protein HH216_15725 [Spirosoma rhododendri]